MDSSSDIPAELTEISPLRSVAIDVHEIASELKAVGFSERAISQIVAHILYDVMMYRTDGADDDYDEEEDDFFDDDDDGDEQRAG